MTLKPVKTLHAPQVAALKPCDNESAQGCCHLVHAECGTPLQRTRGICTALSGAHFTRTAGAMSA